MFGSLPVTFLVTFALLFLGLPDVLTHLGRRNNFFCVSVSVVRPSLSALLDKMSLGMLVRLRGKVAFCVGTAA